MPPTDSVRNWSNGSWLMVAGMPTASSCCWTAWAMGTSSGSWGISMATVGILPSGKAWASRALLAAGSYLQGSPQPSGPMAPGTPAGTTVCRASRPGRAAFTTASRSTAFTMAWRNRGSASDGLAVLMPKKRSAAKGLTAWSP